MTTRQDRYKSIYKGSCRKRTILIQILSPILFFFPDVHLRELEKLWTDEIIVEALWRDFMQKLVSEWTDFVLYVSPRGAQTTPVLTLVNPTVNSDACWKCCFSSNPRCHHPPSIPKPCWHGPVIWLSCVSKDVWVILLVSVSILIPLRDNELLDYF